MEPLSEHDAPAAERNLNSKLNRYIARIEHLITRDRSRSVSPISNRHNKRLTTKGPMINRIDTYIKYEHPLHIITKIMQHNDVSLVASSFA